MDNICIYIISLLSLISSHSLRQSIYLLLPYKIAFHYSPAWEIVSRIKQVTSGDFYLAILYAIWVWRSRDSHINTRIPKIANWHRNRIAKTASPYISLFGHGRRLNSIVSDHAKQWKNLQNFRIWNTLHVMQRTI